MFQCPVVSLVATGSSLGIMVGWWLLILLDRQSWDFQEPIYFRVIRTSFLYNRSWTQNLGSVWLDELQTHAWDNKTHTFTFLWPWSQVRPEAWLSAGPSPGSGRLLLVCHISGFHPKPVWVMWMRGEQEQRGTQRGDVLPHADGTWYLQMSLDVKATEAAGLSCRVRHSSLGGQDMVLYWEQPRSMGLVFLAVIVPLVLLAGLALWLWKRW
uniref:Ig-like domain-containing protein n=1 Tax=Ursus americanus TaxID=9643 RepID=A0A452R9N7_URSAM